jgi:RNA polymerase sigma factor (sigma-70 family)
MEDPPEDGQGEEYKFSREQERRASALALRYRLGDLSVLGELFAELAPFITRTIRPHYTGPNLLPPAISPEDLYQQAYVELAEMVLEWEPGRRANFAPYFLRAFPWRINHYLRSQTPARRTARLQMLSTPHDVLMRQIAERPGLDGRDWDSSLAWTELLSRLPELSRRVVQLHVLHGLSFAKVAVRMGISRSTIYDTFKHAMMLMRSMIE